MSKEQDREVVSLSSKKKRFEVPKAGDQNQHGTRSSLPNHYKAYRSHPNLLASAHFLWPEKSKVLPQTCLRSKSSKLSVLLVARELPTFPPFPFLSSTFTAVGNMAEHTGPLLQAIERSNTPIYIGAFLSFVGTGVLG